ncbi:MAG TPA: CATRA system-associated protein [Thermomonospora sp.]|nr:CATRA system-associated protein [Thermomonospora sp.]
MRDRRPVPSTLVAELTDVLEWRLTQAAWAGVAEALDELARALPGGDRRRIEEAQDSLAFSGPIRLRTRLGDDPAVPPPEDIRERVNRLIHDLESDDDRDAD